jgi:ABC-type transporter Mla subunit MlaD
MALIRRKSGSSGMSPVAAGLIALAIVTVAVFFGFTRWNPFHNPFELKAVVQSANNLQPKSPVRIAGVNVGMVKDVEAKKGGGAVITMEIEKRGLPIKQDAQIKIRPRIFLEGNFFVDIQPGSPSAKSFKSGSTVPIQQTAAPVQFGQLLTALQSDTRADLQTFLYEYAQKALGNGGAQAYNKSLDNAPAALRYSSIANDASLGQQPHDLSNLLRGQQRLAKSLTTNPAALKDLVTQLNTTALAFARQGTALQAAIPALDSTLKAGTPALVSLDNALPSLRSFAQAALPGTKSSPATIDASIPLVHQLRLLVRPQELQGLVHDLRPTIPALARLNHQSVPFLAQNRALSRCTNKVLVPFAKKPIPNPDESEINNQPFYKLAPRGLVGLAGESRMSDANSPAFHIQFGSGPTTLVYTHNGQNLFAAAPQPPEGVRPIKPDAKPKFRPGIPCETQQVPDMNAPGGPAERSVTAPGSGLLPPLPGVNTLLAKAGNVQLNEIKDYMARRAKGKDAPDPVGLPQFEYLKQMKKLGLAVDRQTGKVSAK